MNKKLLSIIIVNYNGEAFLINCIESINRNCQTIDFEIIIVDNNSTDESIKIIENKFPEVVLIKNKTNFGFAVGNNIGANLSQGEYLLLLNNDTLLLDNLNPAINILRDDQSIGLVGIKMLDEKKQYRQSAGLFPSPIRLLKLKLMMLIYDGFSNDNFDKTQSIFQVDWIEGSFFLTRRNLWEKLKGMDESFFMYAEDIDFCKRLNDMEKKTVYLPELSYIHYGGFNSKRNELLKIALIHYVNKHFSGIKKWISRLNIEINFFVKKHAKKSV
ncbi:MAG: glycosyltransferase family 2 protein [Bacteroidales bacterium]|nr:glycosyltransferase family 2 protein [Bacteroidales bacterium]